MGHVSEPLYLIALAVTIGVAFFLARPATLHWLRPVPLPDVVVYLPSSFLGDVGFGPLGGLIGLAFITAATRDTSGL